MDDDRRSSSVRAMASGITSNLHQETNSIPTQISAPWNLRPFTLGVLFLLFFFSGLSGLVYQVVWVRMAFASFGILIQVLSVVLSVFMLGLSLGAWAGGRVWLGAARERTVLPDGPTERAATTTTEAGFELDRRDDRLAPRRGSWARVESGTVFKRETLRPEGSAKATQLLAHALAQTNRGLGHAAGLRFEAEGALRLSNEPVVPLYDQDLVGGATTMRGYREGEFRASRWVVTRLEYGVFTADKGRAFAFFDNGVLYRPFLDLAGAAQHETLDRPGYGVGFEAPMSLGRLALTLAYGRGDGPLDGKVHVRLTTQF